MRGKGPWLTASFVAILLILIGSLVGRGERVLALRLGYLLEVPSEFIRFLPIAVILGTISAWINCLASGGLFSMALKGEGALFRDFLVGRKPFLRMFPMAVAASIASTGAVALLYLMIGGPLTSLVYLGVEILAAPFFCLVIPVMLDRQVSFVVAFRQNLRLLRGNYFRFLVQILVAIFRVVFTPATLLGSLVIAAFFTSYGLTAYLVGLTIIGIGLIWSLPNYQRTIVELYKSVST